MTVCGEKVTGVFIVAKCPHFKRCCPAVWDKYGKIKPKTNEEWLKSLDTEQLAEWLRGVYWHCHEIDCKHCNYPWRCMEKGDIVEWLKQPHTDKE
jgi:hypothetical protein